MDQKGGIALILLIIIIAAGLLIGVYLVSQKTNLFPKASTTPSSSEPNVTLKEEYKNPFDEKSNYSNPFDSYQNPFESLK